MELLWLHPEVANRSCTNCRKYFYKENGQIATLRDFDESGNVVRVNKLRGSKQLVPCQTFDGCPKGTFEDPKGLTERNRKAYAHYNECRATGDFPKDPLVKWMAGIIYSTENTCQRIENANNATMLARASANAMG